MQRIPGSGRVLVIVPDVKRDEEAILAAVTRRIRSMPGAELASTSSAAETAHVVREAVRDGVERIVGFGGDGTLHVLVNACCSLRADETVALGIIPAGTGNDFAGSAGIPHDDTNVAMDIAFGGEPFPIDIGRMNERYFLNLMSGGYGPRVTTEISEELKEHFGGFAYFLSGVRHIRDLRTRFGRLTAPGFTWEGEMYGFAVCNGRTAGGGIVISPDAYIDDGLLDLVVFPGMPLADFGAVLKSLIFDRTLTEDHGLIVQRVGSLELDLDAEWKVSLDGEPYAGNRYTVKLLPRRLHFCLPARSPLLARVIDRKGISRPPVIPGR